MPSQPDQARLSVQLALEDQADPQDQVVRQDPTTQLILQGRVDLQGVALAHAVQIIVQDWPPLSRNDALIATAKGFLRSREIHELYARSDFPGRARKRSRRRSRDQDAK